MLFNCLLTTSTRLAKHLPLNAPCRVLVTHFILGSPVACQESSEMSLESCSTFEYGEEDFIHRTAPWVDKDAPQLSKFDVELQQRWDHAMANGAFRYDINDIQTRILPGPNGYVAQLNVQRGVARRAPQKISSVKQSFNPKEFNFNKVKPIEVVFNLSRSSRKCKKDIPKIINDFVCEEKNSEHSITVQNGVNSQNCVNSQNGFSSDKSDNVNVNRNVSNDDSVQGCDNVRTFSGASDCLQNGSILSSDQDKLNNQRISNGIHGTGTKNEDDTSHMLVINVSPMEYGHCLLVPNRKQCLPQVMTEESLVLAIETLLLSRHRGLRFGFNSLCAFASVNHLHYHVMYMEYELISDYCNVEHLAGMYYEYTALPCPGFALQLHGSTVGQLARQAYRISNYLYESDIAHNMFMCRGVVFGEERNSSHTTVRLFIWPRRKFIGNKSSEEFNVACIELVGHLPVKIEDGFHNLTEPVVDGILADACLPPAEYEAIKAKVVEMGKEDFPQVANHHH